MVRYKRSKNMYALECSMKRFTITFLLVTLANHHLSSNEDFQVLLEPKWENLQNSGETKEFGGKWILLGSITFKKKSKEDVKLHKMYLKWHGQRIKDLNASLYKKTPDKRFLPIEENLVCDSYWNPKGQTLVLNFNKKHRLGAVDVFYLVLTVPKNMERKLKNGHFTIQEQCLPGPFKGCAVDHKLALAVNIPEKGMAPGIAHSIH